ncbi:McrB family protein [Pontibacter harenae]|uniref:McrB family protein n=1 Tax=Pontibacter harenae TaxID=2894083 RepID=UPI001E2D3050|nr:AAA family ATPase [Pontibacter harenae]MCC9168651.1 AAA family ATPase [Pontibacter harenae]
MAFEPDNITKEHILKAAFRIKAEGLSLTPSTRWDVVINNENYPPTDVLRLAHQEMNGESLWQLSEGRDTNRLLEKLGFEIKEKKGLLDPLKELIQKYKKDVQQSKLVDEIYKWKLVNQYRGRPNLNAPDFFEEIKSINYSNLIYGVGIAVIYHLAKDRSETYRACFRVLFDESLPLAERLNYFDNETYKIYREIVPEEKYSHHQDERTMATFLAFNNPDKYPFYKDSFYQKYCKLIGVKSKKKGEKYLHYLELVDEFISNYLEPDTELIEFVDSLLPADAFRDTNHKILAQDILYRMLDRGLEEIEVGDASVYKISMGEFNDQDIEACISERKVLVHQSTKPMGRSNESQATVFAEKMQVGDYFYLTPGNRSMAVSLLGKITGDAAPTVYKDYGDEGWLERPFELISVPKNKTKYKGTQKWWTPNSNSTCVIIKGHELDEANKQLFEPYFITKLVQTPPVPGDTDNFEEEKKTDNKQNIRDMPLNQILYGPPGTGKTYHTINKALEILGEQVEGKDRSELKKVFEYRVAAGQIVFTTFHQSMSYEDFIEGIKPLEPKREGQPVTYKVVDGVFKKLCSTQIYLKEGERIGGYEILSVTHEVITLKKPRGGNISFTFKLLYCLLEYLEANGMDIDSFTGKINSDSVDRVLYPELEPQLVNGYDNVIPGILKLLKNNNSESGKVVLIIDEINRGNVSQIFGELITLIEDDKRQGGSEQLEVTLPYSKEKFGIPSNLYIIGTMNTADRSVEALDTALRRRFSFVEMPPRYDLPELETEVAGFKLKDILQKINRRIERLLGKDNLIGHSYFLCVESIDDLRAAFQNKIIPLLQEYFYGDYGKIGLVLGEGFFERAEAEPEDDVFSPFRNYDAVGLAEKEVYHLAPLLGQNSLSEEEFTKAVQTLIQ